MLDYLVIAQASYRHRDWWDLLADFAQGFLVSVPLVISVGALLYIFYMLFFVVVSEGEVALSWRSGKPFRALHNGIHLRGPFERFKFLSLKTQQVGGTAVLYTHDGFGAEIGFTAFLTPVENFWIVQNHLELQGAMTELVEGWLLANLADKTLQEVITHFSSWYPSLYNEVGTFLQPPGYLLRNLTVGAPVLSKQSLRLYNQRRAAELLANQTEPAS